MVTARGVVQADTYERLVRRIVQQEMESRKGKWNVSIGIQPGPPHALIIKIGGPSEFSWEDDFVGVEEQDPEGTFIRAAVRAALH